MSSNELEIKAREHDVSDASPEVAAEAVAAAADEVATGYKNIEDGVVTGYKKIESGVVSGYKKIESSVVSGFGKVVDTCVRVLFAMEGESVEDAKARLQGKGKQ